jgi:probable rRNA maturation factor
MPTSVTATSRRAHPGRRRGRLSLHLQVGAGAVRAPSNSQVRRWARAALKGAGEITVRIVGSAEGRRLNSRYRGDNHATNVLSFPYGAPEGRVQGDIVLCAPVIAREARQQGKTLESHYAHMTVHAILHLQGYDHALRREAERMETLERKLLAKLGYPDPYTADS